MSKTSKNKYILFPLISIIIIVLNNCGTMGSVSKVPNVSNSVSSFSVSTGCWVDARGFYYQSFSPFLSRDLAEERSKENMKYILENTKQVSNTIPVRVLFSTPSRGRVYKAYAQENVPNLTPDQLDYVISMNTSVIKDYYDIIKTMNLFAQIDISYDDYPEYKDIGNYDYLIYVYLPSPRGFTYHIKGKNINITKTIDQDSSKPKGLERCFSFTDSLERTVRDAYDKETINATPTIKNIVTVKGGTGFAVDQSGIIITAFHIVDGADSIEVKFQNQKWTPAKIIKFSKYNDIAVLKIEDTIKTTIPFGGSGNLKQGDKVFTIGYPVIEILGIEPKYTEGYISSLSGIQDEDAIMQISVPVQPGNSGGPLINNEGEVVGLITSTIAVSNFYKITGTFPQNVNWAVKGDYIKILLDMEMRKKSRSKNGNVVENVKNAVCLIRAKTQ